MADYVKINKTDDRIDLWFLNENDEPFAVGEKLYAINENAYMNRARTIQNKRISHSFCTLQLPMSFLLSQR